MLLTSISYAYTYSAAGFIVVHSAIYSGLQISSILIRCNMAKVQLLLWLGLFQSLGIYLTPRGRVAPVALALLMSHCLAFCTQLLLALCYASNCICTWHQISTLPCKLTRFWSSLNFYLPYNLQVLLWSAYRCIIHWQAGFKGFIWSTYLCLCSVSSCKSFCLIMVFGF